MKWLTDIMFNVIVYLHKEIQQRTHDISVLHTSKIQENVRTTL